MYSCEVHIVSFYFREFIFLSKYMHNISCMNHDYCYPHSYITGSIVFCKTYEKVSYTFFLLSNAIKYKYIQNEMIVLGKIRLMRRLLRINIQ